MKTEKYSVIIPTTAKDYSRLNRDYSDFFSFLPAREIIYIGPNDLMAPVLKDAERSGYADRIKFINENELISFDSLTSVMRDRLAQDGYSMAESSKPGWYYQQFLKMSFCGICDDDYYISWDADTLPLCPIDFFDDEGHPYFDLKVEFLPGYFFTIQNLFGFSKVVEKSFVSEHMIFKRARMAEMIAEIEALPLQGDKYYEKIFYSLPLDNVLRGFSEFETYGSWMSKRHPGEYTFRDWSSIRIAGAFMRPGEMTEADKEYLAKDYNAVTFESYHSYSPQLAEIFHNPEYRAEVSAKEFYQMVIESGFFGKTDMGGIAGDNGSVFPV